VFISYISLIAGVLGPAVVLFSLALYLNLRAYLQRRQDERARILVSIEEIEAYDHEADGAKAEEIEAHDPEVDGANLLSERAPSVH